MPSPDHWAAGRVAVVTGGGRGIGRATALALGRVGARVVVAARTGDEIERVAAEVRAKGGEATPVGMDVGRAADVERLFTVAASIGPPAALVCAAGVLQKATLDAISDQAWEETLRTNLTGTFLCCRRAFTAMREAGGGRIVNFSSLSGMYGTEKFPGLAAYNVSKYGVVGLTEALALEGRPCGISAICVSPGAVDTEMLRQANPQLRPGLTPDDVALLVVRLLDGAMVPASGANLPLFSNA